MKQVIEIAAQVEDLSSEAMVEEKLRLSAENGQMRVEVEGWQSRFEVPTDQLIQAIQSLTLVPTEPPVSLTLVQHLGQKISRLEQLVDANPHQRLELEGFRESLEAFRREIIPRLVVVETWKARLESLEAVADQKGLDEGLSTVLLEDFDRRIKALEAICHDCGDRLAKLEQEDLDLESLEAVADQKGLDEGLSTVLLEDFDRRIKDLEEFATLQGYKGNRFDERITKLEKESSDLFGQIENLKPSIEQHGIEIGVFDERIEALETNHSENDASIVALESTAQNFGDRIAVLENNLAEPPAETAALALYGGEQ